MSTLAELRARARVRLEEQTAAVWTDAEIDEGITATLEEYNYLFPRQAVTTLSVSDGGREVATPAGTRSIFRVILADGAVLPRRGIPVGSTAGERMAWESFAGSLRFSRPLTAQTLTVWYLTDHAIADLPGPDAGLLVLGGVWRALQNRSVQNFKRGGPPDGVSYELVIRRAKEEYDQALGRRRRRLRG